MRGREGEDCGQGVPVVLVYAANVGVGDDDEREVSECEDAARNADGEGFAGKAGRSEEGGGGERRAAKAEEVVEVELREGFIREPDNFVVVRARRGVEGDIGGDGGLCGEAAMRVELPELPRKVGTHCHRRGWWRRRGEVDTSMVSLRRS